MSSKLHTNLFVVGALTVVFVFMPILWAYTRELSTLCMQVILFIVLIVMIWRNDLHRLKSWKHNLFIFGLLMLNIFYLLPVPYDIWVYLPGRDISAQVLQLLPDSELDTWRSVSISSTTTQSSLWMLVALFTIFTATISLSFEQIRFLLYILIAVAVTQSVVGLMQYGGNIELPGHDKYPGVARGTYLNRDHLAGYLEMVFPVLLALLALHLGPRSRKYSMRGRLQFWASLQGNQSILYALAAIIILLALIFTRSRTGVALFMLGLVLAYIVFGRRLGGKNVYGTYGTVIALIVVLAVELGLAPVLDRFTHDPMQDMRWELYSTSLKAIADYFPIGSGHGTFSIVYPAYQLPHDSFYINHLHNDYMEWVFEGGLPMLLLIGFGLFLYVEQWIKIYRKKEWDGNRFIQAGAGLGVFLILLHSAIDFNLHKSLNAVYFTFLVAVFMKSQYRDERSGQ